MFHDPVLRAEAVAALVTDGSGVYVDATTGGGGHAVGICERLGGGGRCICFDADADALRRAGAALRAFGGRVQFVHANFRALQPELHARGILRVQGLLLDLGVSSFQLDGAEKGFSFRTDDRIDMRMDRRQVLSGWDVVNTSDEPELARIIREYGEEREARRIARMIIRARPLDTTGQLAAAVGSAVGSRFLTKVLARVFQAIRIRVNDELGSLRDVLADAPSLLAAGGRIVVISYHSLEDRIVKSCFRDASAGRAPSGHKLIPDTILKPTLRVLTKSPVTPTAEEVRKNPRARSAKMRVAERLPV